MVIIGKNYDIYNNNNNMVFPSLLKYQKQLLKYCINLERNDLIFSNKIIKSKIGIINNPKLDNDINFILELINSPPIKYFPEVIYRNELISVLTKDSYNVNNNINIILVDNKNIYKYKKLVLSTDNTNRDKYLFLTYDDKDMILNILNFNCEYIFITYDIYNYITTYLRMNKIIINRFIVYSSINYSNLLYKRLIRANHYWLFNNDNELYNKVINCVKLSPINFYTSLINIIIDSAILLSTDKKKYFNKIFIKNDYKCIKSELNISNPIIEYKYIEKINNNNDILNNLINLQKLSNSNVFLLCKLLNIKCYYYNDYIRLLKNKIITKPGSLESILDRINDNTDLISLDNIKNKIVFPCCYNSFDITSIISMCITSTFILKNNNYVLEMKCPICRSMIYNTNLSLLSESKIMNCIKYSFLDDILVNILTKQINKNSRSIIFKYFNNINNIKKLSNILLSTGISLMILSDLSEINSHYSWLSSKCSNNEKKVLICKFSLSHFKNINNINNILILDDNNKYFNDFLSIKNKKIKIYNLLKYGC